MDYLSEQDKVDDIPEHGTKWERKPKETNGLRRNQQRQKKIAREASPEKEIPPEEHGKVLASLEKKTKHGRRSYRSLLKAIGGRLKKWVADESISTEKILCVDDDVLEQFEKSSNMNSQMVRESIRALQDDLTLHRVAPEDGVFVLRRGSEMPQPVQPPSPSSDMSISDTDCDQTPTAAPRRLTWEPTFSAIRLTNIMSEEAEAAIMAAVKQMEAHGLNVPGGTQRSESTGAHHVGIWSKFWLTVYATADTLSQNMGAQSHMDTLFQLISEHVNNPIMEFLEEADPEYARTLRRINEYVQIALDDEFIDPPFKHLRSLGPLFNVFAMKYGGSEIHHLDLGDVPGLYAIIVVLNGFEGGLFYLPHLRYHIPLRRRSVLLVDARRLVHSTGAFTGKRFVITGFIDYNTAVHAGIKTNEFYELKDEEFTLWTQQRVLGEQAVVAKKNRKMGRSKPKPSPSPNLDSGDEDEVNSIPSTPLLSQVPAENGIPEDARSSRPVLRRTSRPGKPAFTKEEWKEIIDALM